MIETRGVSIWQNNNVNNTATQIRAALHFLGIDDTTDDARCLSLRHMLQCLHSTLHKKDCY